MEFSFSKQGRPVIMYQGYDYVASRTRIGKFKSWRCREKGGTLKCKAYFHTDYNSPTKIIKPPTPHCHAPDPVRSGKNHARAMMVAQIKKADKHEANAKEVVQSVLTLTPTHVRESFRDVRNVVRIVNRHHPQNTGNTLSDLAFAIPEELSSYILYDKYSEIDKSRIIAVGDRSHVIKLKSADLIIGDAGFRKSLPGFKMMYTWYAKTGEGCLPCVHFLLCDSTEHTFEEMISVIHEIIGESISPKAVMLDFNISRIHAIRKLWPSSTLYYGFGNFSEFINKHICKSELVGDFENCELSNTLMNCLIALAFVPKKDVIKAFADVQRRFPDTPEHNDLINFFQKTFIRGLQPGFLSKYSIHMWNAYDFVLEAGPSTTSVCQELYTAMSESVECEAPSIIRILEDLTRFVSKAVPTQCTSFSEETYEVVSRYSEFEDRMEYLARIVT